MATRAWRGAEGFVVLHDTVSLPFIDLLVDDIDPTWKLLSLGAGKHLSINGNSRMTMVQRLQWDRLYDSWNPEARRDQLRPLAESDRILVVE